MCRLWVFTTSNNNLKGSLHLPSVLRWQTRNCSNYPSTSTNATYSRYFPVKYYRHNTTFISGVGVGRNMNPHPSLGDPVPLISSRNYNTVLPLWHQYDRTLSRKLEESTTLGSLLLWKHSRSSPRPDSFVRVPLSSWGKQHQDRLFWRWHSFLIGLSCVPGFPLRPKSFSPKVVLDFLGERRTDEWRLQRLNHLTLF